jgi:hypothetical protein
MNPKDNATGLLALGVLVIVLSPFWLVILLGLAVPLLIAALLVAMPIALVRQAFTRGSRR